MVGFDERIFKTSQLLRRKITQKETKTCIQFKKEINYSSSHNTIFSSNQVFFFLKWKWKRTQLKGKRLYTELKRNWSFRNIMFLSIRKKNTIILLFYQLNDGGRTFLNKTFKILLFQTFLVELCHSCSIF